MNLKIFQIRPVVITGDSNLISFLRPKFQSVSGAMIDNSSELLQMDRRTALQPVCSLRHAPTLVRSTPDWSAVRNVLCPLCPAS